MKKKALSNREIKIRDVLLEIAKASDKSTIPNKAKKTIFNKNVYAIQFTDLGMTVFEKEDENG